jgi:hypothetical protein
MTLFQREREQRMKTYKCTFYVDVVKNHLKSEDNLEKMNIC